MSYPNAVPASSMFSPGIEGHVEKLDDDISRLAGGKGSLSALSPKDYLSTRRRLICTFVHHCNLGESLVEAMNTGSFPHSLVEIWRCCLRIMEDGVRGFLSLGHEKRSRREQCSDICRLYDRISLFLLDLEKSGYKVSLDVAFAELARVFSLVKSEGDLEFIKNGMVRASKRALLRLIPITEVGNLLSDSGGFPAVDSPVAIESLAIGIPRLLGRVYPDRLHKTQERPRVVGPMDDLGGHYLTNLSGSASALRGALRRGALSMIRTLGRVAERALSRRNASNSFESLVSVDSMILALLATFTSVVVPEDVEEAVVNSGFLSIIPMVIREHEHSIPSGFKRNDSKEDERSSVCPRSSCNEPEGNISVCSTRHCGNRTCHNIPDVEPHKRGHCQTYIVMHESAS